MDNVINLDEKQREYKENVRRLNKNEMILKAREAIELMRSVLDTLQDPEDK